MNVYYALCDGASIRLCNSRIRHVDHNPEAAKSEHQAFTTPQTSGERCLNWKSRPASLPTTPKIDTGD